MRPSLLLALILLDFGWGATGQKRFVFCIPCYILNLELLNYRRLGWPKETKVGWVDVRKPNNRPKETTVGWVDVRKPNNTPKETKVGWVDVRKPNNTPKETQQKDSDRFRFWVLGFAFPENWEVFFNILILQNCRLGWRKETQQYTQGN